MKRSALQVILETYIRDNFALSLDHSAKCLLYL